MRDLRLSTEIVEYTAGFARVQRMATRLEESEFTLKAATRVKYTTTATPRKPRKPRLHN